MCKSYSEINKTLWKKNDRTFCAMTIIIINYLLFIVWSYSHAINEMHRRFWVTTRTPWIRSWITGTSWALMWSKRVIERRNSHRWATPVSCRVTRWATTITVSFTASILSALRFYDPRKFVSLSFFNHRISIEFQLRERNTIIIIFEILDLRYKIWNQLLFNKSTIIKQNINPQ